MSIKINSDRCVGCAKCTKVCPGDLIELTADKKAYNKYPKDCWGCFSCVKECSFGAIRFFLGADIGGQGGRAYIKDKGELVDWIIETPDGNIQVITVNKKDANKY
jgi:adenylylsulfate reductase subunit B